MLVTLGGGVAAASGSMGGTTFSHNRGGAYARQRVIPTNPGSTYQSAVRAALSTLMARWNDNLTAAQRAAWDVYASNVLMPNALGAMINIGGVGHYARSNVPRIQAGIATFPIVDDAPTTYNLGEYTEPAIASITGSTDLLSLTFTNTDDWAGEDEAGMLVYCSRPVNPGINYFKGPYRYADSIDGDSGAPPTSPASIALPFDVTAGQKCFVMARVSRADGRLSTPFRSGIVCV